MTKEDITKEQFDRYIKIQLSGRINMTDIVRGAKLTNLTEEEYENIIFNYKELENKFNSYED